MATLGIAQPLFTELDDGDAFLILGYGPKQILLLAAVATVGVPALLLALEAIAELWSRRFATCLHICFIAGLAGVFVSQLLVDQWTPSSLVHALIATAAGAAFALAYAWSAPVRSVLTVLAPVPIVFLCLFLFFSPGGRLAVAGEGDPPGQPVQLPNPVVMIILDELPGTALMDGDGRIDEARFPNFARLARQSTWYRNATTPHTFTNFAVPAVLSGRRSGSEELPAAVDHQRNLFALLTGNPMHIQEAFTDLCPRSLCPATGSARDVVEVAARTSVRQWLPQALADRVEPISGENDPVSEVARFASSFGTTEEPALHYLHLMLPHSGYAYLPSGKRHSSRTSPVIGLGGADRWDGEPWAVVQAQQAFLLQLVYTDRLLGTVLDRLEATGMYERSLVLVLADHGVSFHPGESRREVTRDNFEDILSVPFFVKAPSQKRGRVSDKFVRNIDAVPTIVDILGLRSPWRWEGLSVRAARTDSNPPLDIHTEPGRRFAFDARAFVKRRDAARRAQAARFGSDTSDLYRIGPHPALVGRAPKPAQARDGVGVELVTGRRPFYDPRAQDLPVRVRGTVVGPRARSVRQIAVALNGRIVATTRTFSAMGQTGFTAMLPERQFRRGTNLLALYEILPGPRLARLHTR